MKNILITIGIPVYNGEKYINQAIDSILNQTYDNFELIITDDGSTDNTLAVLNQYQDSRIKIISDGKNKGISYRLNQQIALAKGRYFVRMDSDDIMFPNRIEKQIEYLEQYPEVDVVGSKAIVIDEQNKIIGERGIIKNIKSINDLFLGTRFLHPTVAGRIEWFKTWKYRDVVSGCEDLDLWIRSYNESIFADILEPLLFYRDPQKIKLKTYLYRQYKIVLCCFSLRKYSHSVFLPLLILFRSIFVALVAILLHFLGKDAVFIKRRNQFINRTEAYSTLLKSIIRNN